MDLPVRDGSSLREFADKSDRDLMTPDQRPVIAMAKHTTRLMVATGGSYHCAKFGPVLGDLAVGVLGGPTEPGSPEEQLLLGMGWDRDRDNTAPVHGGVVPRN